MRPRTARDLHRIRLATGDLLAEAVTQAEHAYRFSPSSYTFEALSAIRRVQSIQRQLFRAAPAAADHSRVAQEESKANEQDSLEI
jgi:hypothetical protein